MEEFKIFVQVALSIFGGVSVIVGGVSAILKVFSPIRKLKDRVDKTEEHLHNDFERFVKLEGENKAIEESNREICKALLVLLNHEITGNGVEKLKERRDELEEFLINK